MTVANLSDGGRHVRLTPASVGVSLSGSGVLSPRHPASTEGFSRGSSSAVGTPARPSGRVGIELIDQVAGHVPVNDCPDLPVGAAVDEGTWSMGAGPVATTSHGPTGAGTPGLRAQGLRVNARPSTPAQAAPTRTGPIPVCCRDWAARGGLPPSQGAAVRPIDVPNEQWVGMRNNRIVVMSPLPEMSLRQALVHAAWLVALADTDDEFPAALAAVRNT